MGMRGGGPFDPPLQLKKNIQGLINVHECASIEI